MNGGVSTYRLVSSGLFSQQSYSRKTREKAGTRLRDKWCTVFHLRWSSVVKTSSAYLYDLTGGCQVCCWS
jgi:hypothetical protein